MRRAAVEQMWIVVLGLATLAVAPVLFAQEPASARLAAGRPPGELMLETLLAAELEGDEDLEVIVSRVTIPPNTSLPKHWHPGEEFAYVLEGSASLWLDGEEHPPARAGELVSVPLRRVHTAITGDEGAVLLVFRVHAKGEPERVAAE